MGSKIVEGEHLSIPLCCLNGISESLKGVCKITLDSVLLTGPWLSFQQEQRVKRGLWGCSKLDLDYDPVRGYRVTRGPEGPAHPDSTDPTEMQKQVLELSLAAGSRSPHYPGFPTEKHLVVSFE